jgi:hypothetical protein
MVNNGYMKIDKKAYGFNRGIVDMLMGMALTGDAALAEVERVTWEPKRAVNSRPMRALEARISRL